MRMDDATFATMANEIKRLRHIVRQCGGNPDADWRPRCDRILRRVDHATKRTLRCCGHCGSQQWCLYEVLGNEQIDYPVCPAQVAALGWTPTECEVDGNTLKPQPKPWEVDD